MNRHGLSFAVGFCVAGLIVFFVMRHQSAQGSAVWQAGELMGVRQAVEKRLADVSQDIAGRLSAFGREAAADQLFALRLIAENNPSAPEVAGKAGGFMGPMGFAFLSVVDSSGTILSSGNAPASRGDRMPPEGAFRTLSEEPKFVEGDAAGGKTLPSQAGRELCLMARVPIIVADSITFYALGGVTVDEAFLGRLSPMPQVKVLLRRGGAVTGMEGVTTMSEVKDGAVTINGTKYPAFSILPDYAGAGDAPELIVVIKK
jgi:hypothetical protein